MLNFFVIPSRLVCLFFLCCGRVSTGRESALETRHSYGSVSYLLLDFTVDITTGDSALLSLFVLKTLLSELHEHSNISIFKNKYETTSFTPKALH